MSRTSTIVAFAATVGLVVPAAWHALDADIQTDGPATRPEQQTLELDGATVTIDLDRGLLMSGGTLKATLVATSDEPRTIALDVKALENMGYGDERVENPPKQVGKRMIKIQARPGGGTPVEVAFKLGGRGRKGVVRWYDVEIAPTKWKAKGEDDYLPTARIGAATWSGNNFAMEIQTPVRVPGDATFQVAVKVTNTQKKPINWLSIELGGTNIRYGGLDSQLYMYDGGVDAKYTITRVEGELEYDDTPLAPGKTRIAHFEVTPSPTELDGVKEYTFTAHAHGDRYGALDVKRVQATETPPSVARQ
jgi:hypothetical protein